MEQGRSDACAGHFGVYKTYAPLKQAKVWWPRFHQDVEEFIRKCAAFQQATSADFKAAEPMGSVLNPRAPMCFLGVDVMTTPLSCDGKGYLLTALDYAVNNTFAAASE